MNVRLLAVSCQALHKKYPYSKLFWSVFSRIRTEYADIRIIFPYLVRMRENTDQNNSEYGHFLCSKVRQKEHITHICRKASRKIYVLARTSPYMDLS